MGNRGSILLTIIFSMVLTMMGIALIQGSLAHLKINKARNLNKSIRQKTFNYLILNLHKYRKKLEKIIKEACYEKNISDLINYRSFPGRSDPESKLYSKIDLTEIREEFFKRINGKLDLTAENQATGFKFRNSNRFIIYKGDIPIDLLNRYEYGEKGRIIKEFSDKEDNFPAGGNDHDERFQSSVTIDFSTFIKENFIPSGNDTAIMLLKKDCKKTNCKLNDNIRFFYGKDEKCSVFINTNVDWVHFSVQDDAQIIDIRKRDEKFTVRYIPSFTDLEFIPLQSVLTSGGFSEKIIINGDVGKISGNENNSFMKNTDIQIVIFGNFTIDGSIDGSEKQYNKKSPLMLFSLCNPFIKNRICPNTVNIIGDGRVSLQLSIFSEGIIKISSKNLVVNGNIVASKIINGKNLRVIPASSSKGSGLVRINRITILGTFLTDYIEADEN